ncbi:hypothetical protein [Paraburkholderia unamae]|uniref:hypothetical protein n=1 Tax=Paraburkholderia unamae TaxID=219649 RepID=UPI001057E72B|nr:hypothetical protein [Paraburkholderia unamae]
MNDYGDKEFVLPSIDWSHVSSEWNWLVQCSNGRLYLHQSKPEPHLGFWDSIDENGRISKSLRADCFASAKPGNGDWQLLIMERGQ